MNIPPLRTLETARLLLRVCQPDDADRVFEAEKQSLPELEKWFWWLHPRHDYAHCVAWAESRVPRWLKGEEFNFLVLNKTNHEMVGCVWLNAVDRVSLRASLGYWLRTGYEGQGFAAEAAREVIRWGFEELGLQRVEILLATTNEKSRKLAERIGAQFEGIARRRLRLNQKSQDARVYSLLPGELK